MQARCRRGDLYFTSCGPVGAPCRRTKAKSRKSVTRREEVSALLEKEQGRQGWRKSYDPAGTQRLPALETIHVHAQLPRSHCSTCCSASRRSRLEGRALAEVGRLPGAAADAGEPDGQVLN